MRVARRWAGTVLGRPPGRRGWRGPGRRQPREALSLLAAVLKAPDVHLHRGGRRDPDGVGARLVEGAPDAKDDHAKLVALDFRTHDLVILVYGVHQAEDATGERTIDFRATQRRPRL